MSTHTPAPSPSSSSSSSSSENNAVEVVATFGDAVVGVRHVTDPRGGVVRAATRALIAGGAALLATSALTFGYATHVADENQAALEAWIAKGKPSWAFRPERLPGGLDPLMLGGSMLGLAALAWGLARRKSELAPSRVRLGTASGVDFAIEGVGPTFDLVAPVGDGWAVHVAPGMTGAPAGSVPVTDATQLRLQLGKTTFHVKSVPAPKPTAMATLSMESRPVAIIAASALVHLGVVMLLKTVPDDLNTASTETVGDEDIFVNVKNEGMEDEVTPPEPTDQVGNNGAGGEQARMALTEGAMGTEVATSNNPEKRQIKDRGQLSVAKQDYLSRIEDTGIFQSDVMKRADWTSITGEDDITSYLDSLDRHGAYDGNGEGSPHGFGNGRRGNGPGGGGDDWNSIWAGDYRTIPGGANGPGDGWNLDGGPGHRRKRIAAVPTTTLGPPTAKCSDASCDTSIIKRYIKRHASKITYCYEKQLLATPGLAGTVDTIFTVMPNGLVVSASAKGVHDEVSSCVAEVISNIKFPKFDSPFQVKYPFHMRPTGA